MIIQAIALILHNIRLHKIYWMTIWHMVCLHTWAPGVKEQDKVDLPWTPQGQSVAAYRCIRSSADGQGQFIPRGTGDSGTPAGSINVGRQTKGGPGAILLRWLRTCVWQWIWLESWPRLNVGGSQEILEKYLCLGNEKSHGKFSLFTQTSPKFSLNMWGTASHARTAQLRNGTYSYYDHNWVSLSDLISDLNFSQ